VPTNRPTIHPTNSPDDREAFLSGGDRDAGAHQGTTVPSQVSSISASQIVDDWVAWIRAASEGQSLEADFESDAHIRNSKANPESFDLQLLDANRIVAIGIELCTKNPSLDRVQEFRQAIDSSSFPRAETLLGAYVNAIQSHITNNDDLGSLEQGGSEQGRLLVATAGVIYESWHGVLIGPSVTRPIFATEGPLLQCIAWGRHPEDLKRLTALLVSKPPSSWIPTALAISPLMRGGDWELGSVFPALLTGLQHPSTAAPVLDLANYCVHSQRTTEHPAKVRQESLVAILGGVISRLAVAEEDPTSLGSTPEEIQGVLSDSIALAVALCDAVGLMGARNAIGKLHQALELQHRRVQTEAAASLARMGEEVGRKALLALAAEPIARLRVIQYAEELGIEAEIDESQTMPLAIAESQLALWLSEPQHFGLPPHSMELVNCRTLAWPGYDEPQQCYLFRYAYRLPQGEISNIGIAGPLTHTFSCDLAELPIHDTYAMFAGWHAEHEEIFEVPASHWNTAQKRMAQQLLNLIEDQGHDSIEPLWLGFFLNEIAVVARTRSENSIGFAVTDGTELLWYPSSGRLRPLGPTEVYSLYKGRKILRSFNGHDVFESEEDS